MELDSISNGTTADLVSYNQFSRDSKQCRHILFHTFITHQKLVTQHLLQVYFELFIITFS